MTAIKQTKLEESYRGFSRGRKSRKNLLTFLKSSMPEMIFRTSKLEGEKVTRRMTSSLFSAR